MLLIILETLFSKVAAFIPNKNAIKSHFAPCFKTAIVVNRRSFHLIRYLLPLSVLYVFLMWSFSWFQIALNSGRVKLVIWCTASFHPSWTKRSITGQSICRSSSLSGRSGAASYLRRSSWRLKVYSSSISSAAAAVVGLDEVGWRPQVLETRDGVV